MRLQRVGAIRDPLRQETAWMHQTVNPPASTKKDARGDGVKSPGGTYKVTMLEPS